MSDWNIDRWLKRVWLVNGVGLLVLVAVGAGFAAVSALSESRHGDRVAVAAPASGGTAEGESRVRAVRFGVPSTVRGTTTRLVLVHNGDDYLSGRTFSRAQYGSPGSGDGDREGPLVNVVFLQPDGAAGRLLFDRPAFLKDVAYPGREYSRADSLQTWISYEAALDDTNGDGKLDEEDRRDLFVTDLDGRNLRRVLPPGWRLQEYESLKDGRTLVVTALEGPKAGERWDEHRAVERAFVYDVPSGRLDRFAALDSLVVQAGRLLGGARGSSAR